MQTFKGDKASEPSPSSKEAGGVPKETAASCVAVPNLGPPEQCEICDSDLGWVQRARPEDHEYGRLGRCRQCDWHLCAVCCDQNARCTCLEHFENPKVPLLSRDFGEGFASLSGSIEADATPLIALYLPPHALQEYVEKQADKWGAALSEDLKVPVRVIVADVPFQMTQACDRGYWFRPHHHKAEERAKILKKLILGGVMCALAQI